MKHPETPEEMVDAALAGVTGSVERLLAVEHLKDARVIRIGEDGEVDHDGTRRAVRRYVAERQVLPVGVGRTPTDMFTTVEPRCPVCLQLLDGPKNECLEDDITWGDSDRLDFRIVYMADDTERTNAEWSRLARQWAKGKTTGGDWKRLLRQADAVTDRQRANAKEQLAGEQRGFGVPDRTVSIGGDARGVVIVTGASNFVAAGDVTTGATTRTAAQRLWHEKAEYLERELAICASPEQKWSLQVKLDEARRMSRS